MHARLAIITFVDGRDIGPDNSLPGGQGGRPDQSLPGSQPGIDNSLPAQPGVPVQLPVYPFDPTAPDNTLPGGSPPHGSTMPIVPGARFKVKWLACKGLILVPDHALPPGSGHPDNALPPTAAPKK